jgi:hypothetical protein
LSPLYWPVKIEDGPRKIFQRDRYIGTLLDNTHLKVSFSGLGFTFGGLEIDGTKLSIFSVTVWNSFIPGFPDLLDIGVVAAGDRDHQIERNIFKHSDI